MLDSETKDRINSARDILVGKVPDPKSQVEQITIALIYKFMDDMDTQAEELGGKPSFFKGEFKKYRWAALLDKRVGGHERLLLYAEGIEKMNHNKNIPQLFRDIFKGVFLPYRDPETLNLFLKEINGFTYEHSERLGDAYEHLLNILGTQGAAGQFRTPRHIIDFIVAAVDPQKHETVLDPACGTAGFLISAYKHIVKQNESLTPDERARLMTNFCGYDIAPDMGRLSRVNMYLHGFANPVIHEYDTLTSEQRWDERYDVIMANPPFMTPKGGIRPHNRFSIKANRSEVLFVDYIAEHLNPGGRAGVIVPEGIIFQSQNAYKQLRRMLVENYLWAVVSLPAGVFNPYSGVKTSILLLDRNLAKRTDAVLFVKIENEGFGLGAQRRKIEGDELPEALKTLLAWKNTRKMTKGDMAHAVSRKRLLKSPDCSFAGDRYRPTIARGNGHWPIVPLGTVAAINRRSCDPLALYGEKTFVYLDISSVENRTGLVSFGNSVRGIDAASRAKRVVQQGDILLSTVRPNLQAFAYLESVLPNAVASTGFAVLTPQAQKLNGRFLYNMLFSEPIMRQMVGRMGKGAYPSITQGDVEEIEIPLPPLVEQERMAAELEGYRKVIEGARQVVDSYKPTVSIDCKWPTVPLADLVIIDGVLVDPKLPKFANLPHVNGENMESGTGRLTAVRSAAEDKMTSGKYLFDPGCVLYSKLRPYLRKAAFASFRGLCSADMYPIRTNPNELAPEFLLWLLLSERFTAYAIDLSHRARMPKLNREQLLSYSIPLPPLDTQREIVAELEAEQKLLDANRELITRMEKKIQARLAEIWDETAEVAR